MTNQVIPEAAVEAAADIVRQAQWGYLTPERAVRYILESAAPHMLNLAKREAWDANVEIQRLREETRLAHLDAVVNARTVDKLNTAIEAVIFILCEPGATAVPWNKPDLVPPFYSNRIRGVITEALSK